MQNLPNIHKTLPTETTPDPYRVFFPLGVIFGILGVAIWPVYAMGWLETLPSAWHIDIQIQGFMFAFVLGFLMTAFPRFTLTRHATVSELFYFGILFTAQNLATTFGAREWGRVLFALNLTSLLFFLGRRYVKRSSNVPTEFIFIGAGIFLGWVASIIRLAGVFATIDGSLDLMARRMLTEGMMLGLVLGIGSKLAPMFWGFFLSSPISPLSTEKQTISRTALFYSALSLLLIASFPIEYFVHERTGLWVRAVLSSFLFFGKMRIHRNPKTKGVLVHALRVSAWAIALSPWGAIFHPQYRVETLHVMFVAGFGIMILSIATRVILSHGNYPVEMERNSNALLVATILLGVAMIFRSISSLFAEYYFQLLAVAGIFWLIGLALWGAIFSARAIRTSTSS